MGISFECGNGYGVRPYNRQQRRTFRAAARVLDRSIVLRTESCYQAHPYKVESHRASKLDTHAVNVILMGPPPHLRALLVRYHRAGRDSNSGELHLHLFHTLVLSMPTLPTRTPNSRVDYSGKTSEDLVFRTCNAVFNVWYTGFKGVERSTLRFYNSVRNSSTACTGRLWFSARS